MAGGRLARHVELAVAKLDDVAVPAPDQVAEADGSSRVPRPDQVALLVILEDGLRADLAAGNIARWPGSGDPPATTACRCPLVRGLVLGSAGPGAANRGGDAR